MEFMDIKVFDDLLDNLVYYDIDLPVIPIDELLEELEIHKNEQYTNI